MSLISLADEIGGKKVMESGTGQREAEQSHKLSK